MREGCAWVGAEPHHAPPPTHPVRAVVIPILLLLPLWTQVSAAPPVQQGLLEALQALYLPAGYPASVTPDYLPYQLWTVPAHITGWISIGLTTSSMLKAVGISAGTQHWLRRGEGARRVSGWLAGRLASGRVRSAGWPLLQQGGGARGGVAGWLASGEAGR